MIHTIRFTSWTDLIAKKKELGLQFVCRGVIHAKLQKKDKENRILYKINNKYYVQYTSKKYYYFYPL